jgi:predicted DCC family thiol-disulfide oxidoreductase YuxK
MANIPEQKTTAVTVWYDSGCPLCIREISLMRRLDRREAIAFVDIQSATGCPIDAQTLLARFHAQEPGQPIVSGAAAFAAMWRAIPVLRPLGLLARFRPVLWVLERLYRGFLKVRPWLQRRVRRIVET